MTRTTSYVSLKLMLLLLKACLQNVVHERKKGATKYIFSTPLRDWLQYVRTTPDIVVVVKTCRKNPFHHGENFFANRISLVRGDKYKLASSSWNYKPSVERKTALSTLRQQIAASKGKKRNVLCMGPIFLLSISTRNFYTRKSCFKNWSSGRSRIYCKFVKNVPDMFRKYFTHQ